MIKRTTLALSCLFGAFLISEARAQEPANLQEAKALCAQSGKPLLMEFVRKG